MLQDDRGTFAIDWDVVHRILRDYHRAIAREAYSRVVTTSESRFYNPFSWSLPDIRSLDVDWDRVRSRSVADADQDFERVSEKAARDVRLMHLELKHMLGETARLNTAFTDQLGSLQSENMARINGAVSSYDSQISAARFLRDTSADGLMVGATILTGGAGAAVLGGGSAMKGWAKMQDTGNAGAAILTGVGSFTFGVFKLGGRASSGLAEDAALAILQAEWETGVGLVEGKSLGEAAAVGSLKLAGPFVDRFFKLAPVKGMIERACIPLTITVASQAGAKNVASTLLTKMANKVATKQAIENPAKAAIKSFGKPGAPPPAQASPVLDSATLGDEALLTLAIVNMQKGIGHGL